MTRDTDREFDLGENLQKDWLENLIKDSNVSYASTLPEIKKIPLKGDQEHFINELHKAKRVSKGSIKEDIRKFNNQAPALSKQELKVEITDEEKEQALSLLKDENLLEKFLNQSEMLGCVGEDDNKITMYLALTSRKLSDPINLIVKGESSAGKSFLVESVTKFFPKEDILAFTAMTPKALYHRRDSLKHKVIIIYERSGAEESDYSIRTLQSEKKLVFSYPCKDPSTGQLETLDIEVEGPIAYVETTTRASIHPENETRCFDLYIDESEEQTGKIFNAQDSKYECKQVDEESILRPWINAQRLLEPFPVTIPYIKHIRFPTKPLRARRDRPRFLALIEASVFLHQYQREKKEMDGNQYLVATITDYSIAYELIATLLEGIVKGVSPRLKALVSAAEALKDNSFGKKELQEKLPDWNMKTITKYLEDAERNGYVEISHVGGKGKAYKYDFIRSTDNTPVGLLPPDRLKALIEDDIPE